MPPNINSVKEIALKEALLSVFKIICLTESASNYLEVGPVSWGRTVKKTPASTGNVTVLDVKSTLSEGSRDRSACVYTLRAQEFTTHDVQGSMLVLICYVITVNVTVAMSVSVMVQNLYNSISYSPRVRRNSRYLVEICSHPLLIQYCKLHERYTYIDHHSQSRIWCSHPRIW